LEVERNPDAFAPPVFPALGEALVQEGQHQQALRWWYFGYVRALTEGLAATESDDGATRGGAVEVALFSYARTLGPGLRALLQAPPPESERLLNEAIDWDERTPRLYSLNWFDETNLAHVWNRPDPTWSTNELRWRMRLQGAREQVISLVRGQVHETVERQRLTSVASGEVDGGGVATEATQMIQSDWRERVRPLRSMRIDCDDATPLAAPHGANRTDFALVCGFGQFAQRVIWLRSEDGEQIADTPFSAGNVDRARLLVQNERLFVPDMRSRNGELRMVDTSGAIERYRPAQWTLPELTIADISPSGRFVALRADAEDIRSIYVVDLNADRIVWHREGFNRDYRMTTPQTENFAFLWERDRQVVPVLVRRNECEDIRCGQSNLVLVDVANNGERVISLPRAMARTARLFGDHTAMVYFDNVEGDRPAIVQAVIALAGSAPPQLVRYGKQEPMPMGNALCAPRQIVTGPSAIRFAAIASVADGSFEISAPERNGFSPKCAVSADGRRLLVVAPPFAHLYSID
jgi:hypothetical protein